MSGPLRYLRFAWGYVPNLLRNILMFAVLLFLVPISIFLFLGKEISFSSLLSSDPEFFLIIIVVAHVYQTNSCIPMVRSMGLRRKDCFGGILLSSLALALLLAIFTGLVASVSWFVYCLILYFTGGVMGALAGIVRLEHPTSNIAVCLCLLFPLILIFTLGHDTPDSFPLLFLMVDSFLFIISALILWNLLQDSAS